MSILQHFRIIKTKSSEGLSPLSLLLGSTSAAAAMWNMYVFLLYRNKKQEIDCESCTQDDDAMAYNRMLS